MTNKLWAAVLPLLFTLASALSSAGWRSQSIYQVITDRFARPDGSTTAACDLGNYCGGTWEGLINKLDYIQGMGFTAIWISPVAFNIDTMTPYGLPYHGYWTQNFYELNYHMGSPSDLLALSNALHARGMYLMVDVVPNMMAYNGAPSAVNYANLTPFNNQKYYHSYCAIDYSNTTSTEDCWMGDTIVSLPDLRSEDSDVQSMFQTWVKQLVSNYSIDGLRMDSAMQMTPSFFPGFVSAAGVYAVGEVLDGNPYTLCPWQSYMPGTMNYPAYYWLVRAFESTSSTMSELATGIATMVATCSDTTLLANFIENHDNPRFYTITTDLSLVKNAMTFSMMSDGIPIMYYGQEQRFNGTTDPYNRQQFWPSGYSTTVPLYTFTVKVNGIRNYAITQDATYVTTKATVIYSDSHSIVTSKGATGKKVLTMFNNYGASGSTTSIVVTSAKSGLSSGVSYTDVISCTVYTTSSTGSLQLTISGGLPMILYPTSLLSGSGLCAHTSSSASARDVSVASSTSTTAARAVSTSTTSTSTTKTSAARAVAVASSSTSTACTIATAVAVTFTESITTAWGDTIKLSGSISQLGSWASGSAISMSSGSYTSSNPIWTATVTLPAGTVFTYKFIKVNGNTVTWESDPNRSYTVPSSCATAAAVTATWR